MTNGCLQGINVTITVTSQHKEQLNPNCMNQKKKNGIFISRHFKHTKDRFYIMHFTFSLILSPCLFPRPKQASHLLDKLALLVDIKVNILINGHGLELLGVLAKSDELLDLVGAEVGLQVTLVLGEDVGLGLLATETVAEGSLDNDLIEEGAVVELDGETVGDGTEGRVVVVSGELGVLDALDLLAEGLDELRGGGLGTVRVVAGGQAAEGQHDGAHVLDAVVAVGKVVHRLELLVDDADAGLVGADGHLLDVGGGLAHGLELGVDLLRGLDGGLRVELGRVGDLEENVLHDVAAVGALELELLALEEDVVEAPDGSGEDGGDTGLALEDLEGQVDGALAGVTGSPRLAGHGVGGVAVGAEGLAVNPGLGDGVGGLLLVEAEHLGDDGGGGDLDEDDVVETDLVVRVEESEAALDLVGLDHALENIADGELLAVGEVAAGLVGAGDPVGDGEDGAKVVRGVAPLGSEPAVVVVEPADHGANVEGGIDGVELVGGTGDLGAVGDNGAWDGRTKELGALLEAEALKTAAESVKEDPSGSVEL